MNRLFPLNVVFPFFFGFFLMILPLRAEEADGEKANPFQLTEEEQKDAEALPPIEWGSAPEIFRDSGFPQDATPLHVAEWIARTGLQAATLPASSSGESPSKERMDQMIGLCDKILATKPPKKIAYSIDQIKFLLWTMKLNQERSSNEYRRFLTAVNDEFFSLPDPEDPFDAIFRTALIQHAITVINILNNESPQEMIPIEKKYLEAIDSLLIDHPLGAAYDNLYYNRITLLQFLIPSDPELASVLEERRQEAFHLIQSREAEIKNPILYHVAIPDPPMTEEKIERARFLLVSLRQKSATDESFRNIPFTTYAEDRLLQILLDSGAIELSDIVAHFEALKEKDSPEAVAERSVLSDVLQTILTRQFLSGTASAEEIPLLFNLFRDSYEEAKNGKDLKPVVSFLYLFAANGLFDQLTPEMRDSFKKEFSDYLAFVRQRAVGVPGVDEETFQFLTRLERRFQLPGQTIVIEGTTTDGTPFDWSDYAGKVVLIDFWGTHCGPCLQEFPAMKEIYKKYHDRGFEIVGICPGGDEANRKRMNQIIAQFQLPWPTLDDTLREEAGEESMNARYGGMETPYPILVGRDGRVIGNGQGIRGENLLRILAELFEEK